MLDGVIIVNKEKGYTSHDVVAKMRGIFKQKKAGHTGTLDPDAEGVLPVCLGKATKLCGFLEDTDKTYHAVLLLGRTTDTQDAGGTTLAEAEVTAGEDEIRAAVMRYVGDYDQVPPMYSALKVNGQKLVDLARRGITVERKARRVVIRSIEIENIAVPRVTMTVKCTKGTYIRTLLNDIGSDLGCGGCMESLVRTGVGMFGIGEAHTLSQLEEAVRNNETDTLLIPPDRCFSGYGALRSLPEGDRFLHNGNPTERGLFLPRPGDFSGTAAAELTDGTTYRVYDSGDVFIGLFQTEEDRYLHPVRIFYRTEADSV